MLRRNEKVTIVSDSAAGKAHGGLGTGGTHRFAADPADRLDSGIQRDDKVAFSQMLDAAFTLRRTNHGATGEADKRFDPGGSTAWLCGGACPHSDYLVTALTAVRSVFFAGHGPPVARACFIRLQDFVD